jgi:magnesium-transporting ATPase (P-type)
MISHAFTPILSIIISIAGDAPLTAVQLLWVNMIMDTLGALALATEPPNDELMKRTPVGRTGKFISNIMWRNILGQALYQFVVIWHLQSNGKELFGLDGPDSTLKLNTILFNSFVFCQVTCIINPPPPPKERKKKHTHTHTKYKREKFQMSKTNQNTKETMKLYNIY